MQASNIFFNNSIHHYYGSTSSTNLLLELIVLLVPIELILVLVLLVLQVPQIHYADPLSAEDWMSIAINRFEMARNSKRIVYFGKWKLCFSKDSDKMSNSDLEKKNKINKKNWRNSAIGRFIHLVLWYFITKNKICFDEKLKQEICLSCFDWLSLLII